MSSLMQLLKARKNTNLSGERRNHNALCTIFLNGMLATVFAVIFPSGQAAAEGSATASLSIKTTVGQGTCELTRNGALFSGKQVFPVPNHPLAENGYGKIFPLNLGLRCSGGVLNIKQVLLKISAPQIYSGTMSGLVIGTHRFGYAGTPSESIGVDDAPFIPGPGILLVRDDDYYRGSVVDTLELNLVNEDDYSPMGDLRERNILVMKGSSQENLQIQLGFILVNLEPDFVDIYKNHSIDNAASYGKQDLPGPWQGEVTLDVIYE